MEPFTVFLIWLAFAAVLGALFLALSFLVIARLLKKKPVNLRSALIVQGTSLLLCLACLSMGMKIIEQAKEANPPAQAAKKEANDPALQPAEEPVD